MTGILLRIESKEDMEKLQAAQSIKVKFSITPGTMPEGMEMKVKSSQI